MKFAIGSDHGGFELKKELISWLKRRGHKVKDFGTYCKESCDYPFIAYSVAKEVSNGKCSRGIIICKSGIGNSIVANKVPKIRAALCINPKMAELSRRHNNANVLILAANFTTTKVSKKIVDIWSQTDFEGGRHKRRVNQISRIEKQLYLKAKITK